MSTAALLWTHNEPEVLFPNIRYLESQVDEILIRDRKSSAEVCDRLWNLSGVRVTLNGDEHGYDQSRVMTEMALEALERGHEWVVPIDPDEIWYANGRPLREALGGMSKDVGMVRAELYNHVATAEDPNKGNPFQTLGWRQRYPLPMPKIAARARPDLVIATGNHTAFTQGVCFTIGPALVIRHFPYRSEDQFITRVRSAYASLLSADLPKTSGAHIRMYGKILERQGEEVLREHFRQAFYSSFPKVDDSLIYDPAPI